MAWREWEHAVGSSRVQATHHTEESCPDVFRRLKLDQAKSSCCVSAAGRKPKLEQTQESFESQWNWMTIDYCRYVDMYVYAFYTILYFTISYYTLLYSAILYTIDYILYAINNTLYTIYHILYTIYYILYNILYTIHYTYILKLIQRSVKGFMSGIKPSCRWKERQCSEQFSVLDVIWESS